MQKLYISGFMFSMSGYGEYARSIIQTLFYSNKYDIHLIPLDKQFSQVTLSTEENLLFSNLMKKKIDLENEKDATLLLIATPDASNILKDINLFKNKILLTMFETDSISDSWAEIINTKFDKLIVPTDFNVNTFKQKVKIPIKSITFTKYNISLNTQDAISTNTSNNAFNNITFKSDKKPIVYYQNCQFSDRKGVKETIDCYLKAFKPYVFDMYEFDTNMQDYIKAQEIYNEKNNFTKIENDFYRPTQLWLKWHKNNPKSLQEREWLLEYIHDARKYNNNFISEIYLIHDNLSFLQLETLMNSCDFYVIPSKGEGLNLPAIDAILLEKPVIASKCSSHLTLFPEKIKGHYFIEGKYDHIEKVDNLYYAEPQQEQHKFFNIDIESLKQKYIQSYFDKMNNSEKIRKYTKTMKEYILNISDDNKINKEFFNFVFKGK